MCLDPCIGKAHTYIRWLLSFFFFFSCCWLNQCVCERGRAKNALFFFLFLVSILTKLVPSLSLLFFLLSTSVLFACVFFAWTCGDGHHSISLVFFPRYSIRYIQTFSVKEHIYIYKVTRHERILPFLSFTIDMLLNKKTTMISSWVIW